MKKSLIIISIIAIIFVIIFVFFSGVNIYVITHSSGGLIGSATTNQYSINSSLKLKFNSFKKDKDITKDKINLWEETLENGINRLKDIDDDVFVGKYNTIQELIFIINNYIYYYRDGVYDRFYRCNIATYEIEELIFSKYAVNIGKKNIGMHNFVVENNIKTEALINYYPELTKQIDSIDGIFYRETFYDNGRVFFYKNTTLYEYVYKKNKTIKIANFSRATNIDYVFTKNNEIK